MFTVRRLAITYRRFYSHMYVPQGQVAIDHPGYETHAGRKWTPLTYMRSW